ncbi:peptidyl-tRNA hydrolase 2, putative [Plasmodium knowlesi strain H]|uniref:peptidyl-tRNA hydrolase n=1 Tax=Plasmodium knowlesi (strain H) TaxID=5851 RepID=A0A1A7VR03_PLAKH|nr:peptidyl-tRNA hydrolase 2, putative [Plasmodium knowlesi strain H]SBO29727.1 peptidyl-tRNA hydrolase 2, putative [Plasmodium knowlesi strain H]
MNNSGSNISHLDNIKNDGYDVFILLLTFLCGFVMGLLTKYMKEIKKNAVRIKEACANFDLICTSDCKMVFCVRTDIKMNKGKICSQCCHACLAVYEKIVKRNSKLKERENGKGTLTYFDLWKKTGQKKIVLKISVIRVEEECFLHWAMLKGHFFIVLIFPFLHFSPHPNPTKFNPQSLDEMYEIERKAKKENLITSIIIDAVRITCRTLYLYVTVSEYFLFIHFFFSVPPSPQGRTQIEPNTETVIAIEPVPDEVVNKITGQLKLL